MVYAHLDVRRIVTCIVLWSLLITGHGGQEDHHALPERSATFVTSLYDIGRESWPAFNRTFASYLKQFQHLLAVDINLVIFGENHLKDFVKKHKNLVDESEAISTSSVTSDILTSSGSVTQDASTSSRTRFVTLPFQQLPAYKHRERIQYVLKSKDFVKDNDKLPYLHPESLFADYLILMNSKAALVGQVARQNPFNTTHFFWIDAGYAAVEEHVNSCDGGTNDNSDVSECVSDVTMAVYIPAGVGWAPTPLLDSSTTVTYIQLNDPEYYVNLTGLHKRRVAPALAGGFFGGSQKLMTYYERLFNKCFLSQLTEGEVGEDQLVALQAYFEQPGIFNLVKGDWLEAYRLFH